MNPRLMIGVIHDRRRAAMLRTLVASLRAQAAGLPPGQVSGIYYGDGTKVGPWTAMQAILRELAVRITRDEIGTAPSHVLILEDDAVPSAKLLRTVVRAIEARPHDALYFFATPMQAAGAMNSARRNGSAWAVVRDRAVSTLCVALPLRMALEYLRWCSEPRWDLMFRFLFGGKSQTNGEEAAPGVEEAADARLFMYLRVCEGAGQCVSVNSLVEHGAPDPRASLTGVPHDHHRVAHNPVRDLYSGESCPDAVDADDIDWTKGPLVPVFTQQPPARTQRQPGVGDVMRVG